MLKIRNIERDGIDLVEAVGLINSRGFSLLISKEIFVKSVDQIGLLESKLSSFCFLWPNSEDAQEEIDRTIAAFMQTELFSDVLRARFVLQDSADMLELSGSGFTRLIPMALLGQVADKVNFLGAELTNYLTPDQRNDPDMVSALSAIAATI